MLKNVTTDVINASLLEILNLLKFIPTRGDAISYIFQIRFFQVKDSCQKRQVPYP